MVDPPERRQAAEALWATVVHEDGAALLDPIVVKSPTPNPITVTRAMLRGADAGTIGVTSSAGTWSVVAGSGLLQRVE